jgi:hypothetical protein
MPKVETSIETARPREEVFAYLTDRKNARLGAPSSST